MLKIFKDKLKITFPTKILSIKCKFGSKNNKILEKNSNV